MALLLGTFLFYPADATLARYDFLTIAAVPFQAALLATRLESWREARVILAFHVVGTAMELFKTAAGSWVHPEPSLLSVGGVPLFSGFMYAAVGSYIARIWRLFEFCFTGYSPAWCRPRSRCRSTSAYLTHHWMVDLQLAIFAAVAFHFVHTQAFWSRSRTACAGRTRPCDGRRRAPFDTRRRGR